MVSSPRKAPLPAQAADLLRADLRTRIRKVARLLKGSSARIDARFLKLLARRGFDADQSKALAGITAGAAAQLLGRRKSLADFFEQVEYCGRRLAKLDVAPDAVLSALAAFDRLAGRIVEPGRAAEARWVSGQLNFCTVLTLNNAFYQVREAETDAFFELHDAELAVSTPSDLVAAYLRVLARFVRADAACAAISDASGGVLLAGDPEPPPLPGATAHIREPRMFWTAGDGVPPLLDPAWAGKRRMVWSIPLGDSGTMQFGFDREYRWLPRELRLLTSACARCITVLDKLRLTDELAARERQVRELAARMVETEERERRRIRRELHDETAQILPYLRLQLEMLERETPPELASLKKGLVEAQALIGSTVVDIRRVLSDLSPAVLEQLGLAAAVRQLLNRLREFHGMEVRLDTSRLGELPKDVETAAYRLMQECCNNIARHSSASRLNVLLSTADGKLTMRIEDNGVGFRVEEALAKAGSYGLAGMRERVALAGGRFDLWSRPGRGTRISAEIPVPEAPIAVQAEPAVRTRRKAGNHTRCA